MAKKSALGRGIGALIGDSLTEALGHVDGVLRQVPIGQVHPNPHQPRTHFSKDELEELASSIKQVGILQPIVVRPAGDVYEIIAGERRYQAAIQAGLTDVPVIVRETDDDETLELALIENIQRSDLNAMEEACAYRALMDRMGLTQEQLAQKVAKSRSSVANALRLLDLPENLQRHVVDGNLTAGHARALLGLPDDETRNLLAEKVMREHLSVRQTEALVPLYAAHKNPAPTRTPLPDSLKKTARQLKKSLATNVKISNARGAYKIEIDFKDEDDLDRIIARLTAEASKENTR